MNPSPRIKVFAGDMPMVEQQFNNWSAQNHVKVLQLQSAASLALLPVQGASPRGLMAPGAQAIAVNQVMAYVLTVLYEPATEPDGSPT